MTRPRLLLVGLLTLLIALGGGDVAAAAVRHTTFGQRAAGLRQSWARDQAQGVPAAALAPLRRSLQLASTQADSWWAPSAWLGPERAVLSSLRARTTVVWAQAVWRMRGQAAAALTAWQQLVAGDGHWLPASTRAAVAAYPAALAAARTPAEFQSLAAQWQRQLVTARAAATHAAAVAARRLAAAGGASGLLGQTAALVAIARSDNLDPGAVLQLAAAYRAALKAGTAGTAAGSELATALGQLQGLIALNDAVAGRAQGMMDLVDQAGAEQVTGSLGLVAAFQRDQSALSTARTRPQLLGVQQHLIQLVSAVTARLAADRCGHPLPSGKVITISLSLQEMVFYDNGCAVRATPVTTGRPLLRTPTGTFHIFDKQSPYVFISPWPPGSPFWYPTSPVNWVMEFAAGGYYIHDAPWEPTSAFGPGSENTASASHGCVHTPGAMMAWVYPWTPLGTPVIISN
ncbi:MAG TPA: L,D-transpeptidase [Candidatus Dormibacteraeota bacterium]|nr:L,D-transpeptidase [Candidatus Dormibacteraeota bacterium]